MATGRGDGSKAALADVLILLDQPLPAQANQPEPEPLALQAKQFVLTMSVFSTTAMALGTRWH